MSAKYKPSDYEVLRHRCAELKEAGWVSQTLKSTVIRGWMAL